MRVDVARGVGHDPEDEGQGRARKPASKRAHAELVRAVVIPRVSGLACSGSGRGAMRVGSLRRGAGRGTREERSSSGAARSRRAARRSGGRAGAASRAASARPPSGSAGPGGQATKARRSSHRAGARLPSVGRGRLGPGAGRAPGPGAPSGHPVHVVGGRRPLVRHHPPEEIATPGEALAVREDVHRAGARPLAEESGAGPSQSPTRPAADLAAESRRARRCRRRSDRPG